MKFLSGKKTYSVALGMIVTSITPAFTAEGIDPGKIDVGMLFEGLGLLTIRQGVAKVEKKVDDSNNNSN